VQLGKYFHHKKYMKTTYLPKLVLLAMLGLPACQSGPGGSADRDWAVYGGDHAATRYVDLAQITPDNVAQLQVAWTYETGDADTATHRTQLQANPLVIDGVLYGVSPTKKYFALNAATGQEIWQLDPKKMVTDDTPFWAGTVRGLAFWQGPTPEEKRLLVTLGPFLLCLDAQTGQPITSFGDGGKTDLRQGLGRDPYTIFLTANTPGVIYRDLIIMGMRLSENAGAAPGHIRAYDVRTGKQAWIFHTIPQPGEFGHDTWLDTAAYRTAGGANCWAGMSLDAKRGMVFASTGSATADFYGGFRKGDNLFANCILALDAATGKRKWHYQTVHHDIWDRDLPANPNLVTVKKDGKMIEAVAQITKTGFVFVLDRDTGQPVYPIVETPVPQTDLPGEQTSPTQPIPSWPEPFSRHSFAESEINPHSRQKDSLLAIYKSLRHGHFFTPPNLQGSLMFPGFDGGGEWGGAAFDPTTNYLYVNANEMPWVIRMVKTEDQPTKKETIVVAGKRLYAGACGTCHGQNLEGGSQGVIPALANLKKKFTVAQVADLVAKGRNMMPAFSHLPSRDREAIVAYLMDMGEQMAKKEYVPTTGLRLHMPYQSTGYNRFLDADGYPAISPPWGTLNAIDLNTGKIAWKTPLGEFAALSARGIPPTGTENYGGPVATAGGLVFIGASQDEKFRAFDKKTGKILWETALPAGGYATPCSYSVQGKQYVVIACGGGKMGTKSGGKYVAFALPEQK
jgi:quinoprotein glucose dehydrogenase